MRGGEPGRAPRLKGRAFTADFLDRVLHQGVPNTNMTPWKDRLTAADVRNVIAYISSLEQVSMIEIEQSASMLHVRPQLPDDRIEIV